MNSHDSYNKQTVIQQTDCFTTYFAKQRREKDKKEEKRTKFQILTLTFMTLHYGSVLK